MQTVSYSRSVRSRAFLVFFFLNFLLSFCISYRYVLAAGVLNSILSTTFVHLALIGQIGLFCIVLALVLTPIVLLDKSSRLMSVLAPLLFSALAVFLFIDTKLFSIFRFHFNALAINVLTTPGGFESMEIPTRDLVYAGIGIVLLLTGEFFLFRFLLARFQAVSRAHNSFSKQPFRNVRAWSVLIGVIIAAGLVERGIYATGDVMGIREITKNIKIIPFYQPLGVRDQVKKVFGIVRESTEMTITDRQSSLLNYPKGNPKLSFSPDAPNVVWIVLESWRWNLLSQENTPHMWEFAKQSQVFNEHVSGGNCTRFGIFAMLYGLTGSYWHNFLNESRGPLLISSLKDADYRFRIIASTSLRYPEFRRTAFVDIPADIRDGLPGENAAEKDRVMVREFHTFMDEMQPKQRFFSFLFFDSSHGPFTFPADYDKFKPYKEDASYGDMGKKERAKYLFNRYRNSVYYEDTLVEEVLGDLRKRDLLKNTIVVITGDHGQEFFEHGFSGHNGAFTPEQIHVPLILYVPGRAPQSFHHLTEHQDLPQTIFNLLGAHIKPESHTTGRDLFDTSERSYVASCGFTECALMDNDGWLVFGAQSEKAFRFEARDRDYREIVNPASAIQTRAKKMQELMLEMGRFFK